jgi:hypothetical protein
MLYPVELGGRLGMNAIGVATGPGVQSQGGHVESFGREIVRFVKRSCSLLAIIAPPSFLNLRNLSVFMNDHSEGLSTAGNVHYGYEEDPTDRHV